MVKGGFYNSLLEYYFTEQKVDLAEGSFFDMDWVSLKTCVSVDYGGVHWGQMPQLLYYVGDDVVLQLPFREWVGLVASLASDWSLPNGRTASAVHV